MAWPGDASVLVSVVHVCRKPNAAFVLQPTLNGITRGNINSQLKAQPEQSEPFPLSANSGLGHNGTTIRSDGFVLDLPEALSLLGDPANAEIVLPLTGGEDVNAAPSAFNTRYVITFGSRTLEEAKQWPALLEIVRERVLPQRLKAKDHGPGNHGKKYWWQHGLRADPLYEAIRGLPQCIVCAQVSTHHAFRFEAVNRLFNHKVFAFAFSNTNGFACLQSGCHEIWSATYSSRHGDATNYSVSRAFETFPFPNNSETDPALEAAGKEYYEYRAALMVEHDEGLTKTYNRFHDPAESNEKILRLRELHAAMDRAVLDAYGWKDVPTACGFALDWLDLDDDELADTLASAPDDIRERIESADYFFPDAAAACRFQSHIKQSGRGKLPWRYRWPDEVRDDVLARLLALNAARAELERLTGLSSGTSGSGSTASPDGSDSDADGPAPSKAKRAKKATKRESKKSAPRPMFDE